VRLHNWVLNGVHFVELTLSKGQVKSSLFLHQRCHWFKIVSFPLQLWHTRIRLVVKIRFEKTFDNIHWSYLLFTFQQRGFNPLWMSWMQRVLWGWGVIVLLSWTALPGYILNVRKGFAKAIPFGPICFCWLLRASKILSLDIAKGHFEGLGPVLSHN
jgi:hypothetical protein